MSTSHLPTFLAVALLLTTTPRGRSATYAVVVDGSGFFPPTLSISAGDTVIWFNSDEFFSHTTTSDLSILDPDYWNGVLVEYEDTFSKTFGRAGTFTYHDTLDIGTGTIIVGGANPPPAVAITEPAANTVFNAPANFTVVAQASDADGILAVEFLVDDVAVGLDLDEPYSTAVTALEAGSHTLTAVATDGLFAQNTNSISILVVAVRIRLENPRMSGGLFLFEGTGLTPGRTNVLQTSTDLASWRPVRTNSPSSSMVTFTNTTTGRDFFRLIQLP